MYILFYEWIIIFGIDMNDLKQQNFKIDFMIILDFAFLSVIHLHIISMVFEIALLLNEKDQEALKLPY